MPEEVRPALALRGPAANNAVLAASAPLSLADIADVATSTDSGVAATWLMERTRGLRLNIEGKQLVALADQGVPAAVIDVIVALAHPEVFAMNAGSPSFDERRASQRTSLGTDNGYFRRYPSYYGMYSSSYYDPYYSYYDAFSPYGYYGYRNGYGSYSPYATYYPGYTPVVVVNRPGDTQTTSQHGRVVKGRGYTSSDDSPGASASKGSTSTSGSSGSSGSSPSGSSSGTSSSGSSSSGSSSGGGDRTAVRRPPTN